MATTTYRITGLEKVLAELTEFPEALKRKVLNGSLRKGAVPIQATAKRLAPKGKTGKTSASIRTVTDKKPYLSGLDARVVIFVPWRHEGDPYWWRHQEFGSSRNPPHPFMRPAFDIEKQTALALILADIAQAVPRVVASLKK